MSKFIFSLALLILILYINCESTEHLTCYDKRPFGYNYNETRHEIIGGSSRTVWHHDASCSYLPTINGDNCCYIHIEYESYLDGNRYDKYGCINVSQPFEEYGGTIDNVKNRVDEVKSDFINAGYEEKKVHVKILCSSNFLKFSAFALLAFILF